MDKISSIPNIITAGQPTYEIYYEDMYLTNKPLGSTGHHDVVRYIYVKNDRREPYTIAEIQLADPIAEFPDKMKSDTIEHNHIVIRLGYGNDLKTVFTGYIENANLQYTTSGWFTKIMCASYEKKITKGFGHGSAKRLYHRPSSKNPNNSPSALVNLLIQNTAMSKRGIVKGTGIEWYNRSGIISDWKEMSYHFSNELNFLQIIHTLALLNRSVFHVPTDNTKSYGAYVYLLEHAKYFNLKASTYRNKAANSFIIDRDITQLEFRYNDQKDVINQVTIQGAVNPKSSDHSRIIKTHSMIISDFGSTPRSRTYSVNIPHVRCINDLIWEILEYTAQNPNRVELTVLGNPYVDPKPSIESLLTGKRSDIFTLVAPIPSRLFPNLEVEGMSSSRLGTAGRVITKGRKIMKMVGATFYVETVEHTYTTDGYITKVRGSEYFSNPLIMDTLQSGMIGVGITDQRCHNLIMRGKVSSENPTIENGRVKVVVDFGIGGEDEVESVECEIVSPIGAGLRGAIAIPNKNESVVAVFPSGTEGYIIGYPYYQNKQYPDDLAANEIRIGNTALRIDSSGNLEIGKKGGTFKRIATEDYLKEHSHTGVTAGGSSTAVASANGLSPTYIKVEKA